MVLFQIWRTNLLPCLLACSSAFAGEYFLEAESFTGSWKVVEGPDAREASGLKMLSGAAGDPKGIATTAVEVKDAGRYHIWVRYSSHPKWRGPFHLTALAGERVLGDGLFDAAFEGHNSRDKMAWRSFEADLPEGEVTLRLSKHENKNSSGVSRLVDCVLLTMDPKAVPDHLNYGAQTFVRVTLGDGYEKPAYIHIFADHYHADWYAHWSLGKSGPVQGIQVKKQDMLRSGESTGWCNLTPTIYQDSGAMLYITARHGYTDYAPRLKAKIDFATAPDEKSIVRSYDLDNSPSTVAIYTPPNLLTEENKARLKRDLDIAEDIGKQADLHTWPTHGKKPEKFPFFATATIDKAFTPLDARVREREEKTLGYFGFNERPQSHIGGAWHMKDKSYCLPDLEKMRAEFQREAAAFKDKGGKVENIVFCELTDEPTGQPLDVAAKLPGYTEAFQKWLKGKNFTPVELLVKSWDDVNIVTPAQRADFPALYYWSQLFRTRALSDFMAAQGKLAKEAYGGDFPVLANFSDGAVYGANFCIQGVDYFELLDSDDQNAIWGEDWSNGASSYQCASYNVDLMRGAARERGQKIAHHLVAHANRKPWDVKLKATSEAARGVKIFNNFCYGPTWASHEGGPYFRSHLWHGKPATWTANASITREIGAAEDLLLPAMPAPAQVALLYSTASDVWTVDETFTFGFDRMHTWMALAHVQMPVDIVAERQVERGALDQYKVCYLTGPNLTRAAAVKLKAWTKNGGSLFLTAGAASKDEYNRPLDVLDDILPAQRGELVTLQKLQASGRYLNSLQPKDKAGPAEVLGVKQSLTAKPGAETLSTFADGSAAIVRQGNITVCGFLPALSYIKTALDRRKAAEEAKHPLTERSYNPWDFPADVRDLILTPTASIPRPIECSHALVDAVFMPSDKGIIIPLANYTLEAIEKLELKITTPKKVAQVESAVRGKVPFQQSGDVLKLFIQLENNDFVMLRFE
ncbi:MAG: hypothetical protein U1F71_11250 [Verrucomicrobiaceae bacterium]